MIDSARYFTDDGAGLSHLCAGDLAQAESFLQLAARWAQSPLEQLVGLSNLGTM